MRLALVLWLLLGTFPSFAVLAETIDYPPVIAGRQLAFPADLGAHPVYRTEWWYMTGWLADAGGAERGFQITFFRVRTGIGEGSPSRFAPSQLIFAHAAIADPAVGRLLKAERAARALAPLAGAAEGATRAWLPGWTLEWRDGEYAVKAEGEDFAFDLRAVPPAPPVLNGADGFSRKGPDPRHASHYYSRPHLAVTGALMLQGREIVVTGTAWLDHEWSSELMPAGAQGWDWVGVNLHDGGSLMAFRMRDADAGALWSGGTLKAADDKRARILAAAEVVFEPGRRWRSPASGIEYPVEWTIRAGGRRFEVRPLMDDQELDSRRSTGAIYWEGAVRVFEAGREVGRGYLEMTGYGERLRM